MRDLLDEWFALTPAAFGAICAMMAATYLCRASGFLLMNHVPLTPRVRRGLAALPGSIVMATVVPLALRGGLPAMVGVACGLVAMAQWRNELLALLVGLATVSALRAFGL